MAPRDVLAGADYPGQLTAAIESTSVLVAVWSEHFDASQHTKREVEIAVSLGKHALPLRIADVPMDASSRYLFAGKHWLDAITPPIEAHLARLTSTVKALLGQAPGPVPIPPPRARRLPLLLALALLALVGIASWFALGGGRDGEGEPDRGIEAGVLRANAGQLQRECAEIEAFWGKPSRPVPDDVAAALAAGHRLAAILAASIDAANRDAVRDELERLERTIAEGTYEAYSTLTVQREELAGAAAKIRSGIEALRGPLASQSDLASLLATAAQRLTELEQPGKSVEACEQNRRELDELGASVSSLRVTLEQREASSATPRRAAADPLLAAFVLRHAEGRHPFAISHRRADGQRWGWQGDVRFALDAVGGFDCEIRRPATAPRIIELRIEGDALVGATIRRRFRYWRRRGHRRPSGSWSGSRARAMTAGAR
ncbi:MAG: toll/interleukin-1 receptor domain-containing protein [Planctomycetes bacterium]|nr:toll/interleukin-1 receptor domain-containing protein [Planctomycetota bacterium]